MAALVLSVLAACAGGPAENDVSESGEMLENSLPVAAAALAAGQPDVARRLYLSLAERFEEAPEPVLGLGYIAFHNRDLTSAERYFLEAAERARETPAAKAEALLGAGRSALSRDRPSAARKHLERARESGRDTPSAPWIANGLAVVAALEEDYGEAEVHYAEAMRLSSGDPRVGANLVRMRVAAGRIEDAARAYAGQASSYWVEDDGRTLARLIEEARRERRAQAPPEGAEAHPGIALDPSCARPGRAAGAGTGYRRVGLAASGHGLHPDLALRLSAFGPPAAARGVAGLPSSARNTAPTRRASCSASPPGPAPRMPLQAVGCASPPATSSASRAGRRRGCPAPGRRLRRRRAAPPAPGARAGGAGADRDPRRLLAGPLGPGARTEPAAAP